jgi:hypothetical protein
MGFCGYIIILYLKKEPKMGVKRVLVENQLAKTRMSKKRIEERTTVPIVLGTSRIEMPAEVAANPIAKEKLWTERLSPVVSTNGLAYG